MSLFEKGAITLTLQVYLKEYLKTCKLKQTLTQTHPQSTCWQHF